MWELEVYLLLKFRIAMKWHEREKCKFTCVTAAEKSWKVSKLRMWVSVMNEADFSYKVSCYVAELESE